MWGHAAKAWGAWSVGLVSVLGQVVTLGLVHGKAETYLILGIGAIGALAAVPSTVWKVVNTPAAGREAAAVAAAPSILAAAQTIQSDFKDLHAGIAAAAPWPTSPAPLLSAPTP